MEKRPTAGIILAAGMSSRFGRLKQLLEIGDSTILSMVIDAALESELDSVVLVLGHEADAIKASLGDKLLNNRIITASNPCYQEGMSTSLKRGLMEIKDESPSIMVMMGDQPLLSHEVINLVLRSFRSSDKDICVPVYKGKRGLPVCFTKKYYRDILDVKGDMGAREIIRDNPVDVNSIDVKDLESSLDIDDESDFERLKLLVKNQS